MRIINISLGILWEWVIIPILIYLFLPKGREFYFLFPQNDFIRFIVFLLYLFFGLYFTFLSCQSLHKLGKGTIMPNDPPQKLVKEGVYSYCRNPMYLGYSFLFFAFGFLLKNVSYLFVSIGIIIFIFIYTKLIEEKILIKRFGEEYCLYKKEVPFIFSFRWHKNFLYNFSTFLFLNILCWVVIDILLIIEKFKK
ncbi:MAG: hypothetical protein N2589_05470 [bacterium]|nr:hypothetical protein [bacterium]MCX7917558.1 hypothetical protein [bacterium]MDW8163140.1 methyltransferase [Candidatus Omnitrophota bacterium]